MSESGRDFDVIILGAGPGGLVAAEACAKRGLRTVVIEKKKEIGSQIRTSGATFIGEIAKFDIPETLYHRVETIRFLSAHNEARFTNRPDGLGVLDIRGLLQHLAVRAIDQGSVLLPGTRALGAVRREGRVVGVDCRGPGGATRDFRAPVTIDATGVAGVTAGRILGFKGFKRMGEGLEYDLHAPGWPQEEFVLLTGSEVAPTGYGWIFPWGENRVRAGVGITIPDARGADLQAGLDRLIHDDSRFASRFTGAGVLEVHKGFIPAEPFTGAPYTDGLLLIGDAASGASALAGEGIRYAMRMGILAAEAVAEAIKRQDASAEILGRAHRRWEKEEGRNLRIAMACNRRMATYPDEKWDEAVGYLGRLSDAQFLQFLKSDFTPGLFLKILAGNPALAGSRLVKSAMSLLK